MVRSSSLSADRVLLLGPLQVPHPAGNGPPDLVRRIFLNEMDPRHRLLGQRWPPADEVDQRIIGEDRTWLSLQEQLGHIARPQPVRVFSRDRSHVGGLAPDGYLSGPRQRRPSPLARLGERPSILRHLLVGELTQDGVRQDLFNEIVVLQDHRLAGLRTQLPFTALRWRLAQSKPRAEPQSWMTNVTR